MNDDYGHDKLCLHNSKLPHLENRLVYLATAFLDTGNEVVYYKLLNLAEEVGDIHQGLNEASGEIVAGVVKQSCEASNNMFQACLAGVTIGVEHQNEKPKDEE